MIAPRRVVVTGCGAVSAVGATSDAFWQALLLGRPILLLYAAGFGIAVVAFVRLVEEPTLARRYGARYDTYRCAVPRWWPRNYPPRWAGK